MKRINPAVLAVSLTLSAVALAAFSPLFQPLSGYTLAVGLIVVLAGVSIARSAGRTQP